MVGSGLSISVGVAGTPQLALWLGSEAMPERDDAEIWEGLRSRLKEGVGFKPVVIAAGAAVSSSLREQYERILKLEKDSVHHLANSWERRHTHPWASWIHEKP